MLSSSQSRISAGKAPKPATHVITSNADTGKLIAEHQTTVESPRCAAVRPVLPGLAGMPSRGRDLRCRDLRYFGEFWTGPGDGSSRAADVAGCDPNEPAESVGAKFAPGDEPADAVWRTAERFGHLGDGQICRCVRRF